MKRGIVCAVLPRRDAQRAGKLDNRRHAQAARRRAAPDQVFRRVRTAEKVHRSGSQAPIQGLRRLSAGRAVGGIKGMPGRDGIGGAQRSVLNGCADPHGDLLRDAGVATRRRISMAIRPYLHRRPRQQCENVARTAGRSQSKNGGPSARRSGKARDHPKQAMAIAGDRRYAERRWIVLFNRPGKKSIRISAAPRTKRARHPLSRQVAALPKPDHPAQGPQGGGPENQRRCPCSKPGPNAEGRFWMRPASEAKKGEALVVCHGAVSRTDRAVKKLGQAKRGHEPDVSAWFLSCSASSTGRL